MGNVVDMIPQGPKGLGPKDAAEHRKEVTRIVQLEEYYRGHMSPRFQEMVENWRLYLSVKPELRKSNEKKWRADVRVPYPYSVVETIASVMCDIMSAPDPAIQVEGLGEMGQDEPLAKGLERLFDNTLRYNRWELQKALAFRTMPIQGTEVFKLVWRDVRRKTLFRPQPKVKAAFVAAVEKAVSMGLQIGLPPAPDGTDPVAFEQWRMQANTHPQRTWDLIPAMPVSGWRNQVEYAGPGLERVSIFDMRFNPNIDSMKPLPWVCQRIVVSKDALLRLSGPGPDKPYDLDAVQSCLRAGDSDMWTSWQNQVAEMMGIQQMAVTDPYHEDDCELLEVWEPESPFPFKVVLNRQVIINKNPTEMLYAHGHSPFHFLRNIPVAHQFLGMSEYQQSRRLYHEMDILRSLRLDAVMLQVLPIFVKLRDMGMSDMMKQIRPGMVIDAPSEKAITQLLKFNQNINDAFREMGEIKTDIDDTAATQPQVRGSQATMGRVSATEMQARLNQALVRTKDRVVRAEQELSNIPTDALHLWYQFGDPVTVVRASGGAGDPLIQIQRDQFYEALEYGVRFRSASKILNKDMAVQQLKEFLVMSSQMGMLVIPEIRKTMARLLELMGQKDIGEIVSSQGTLQLVGAQQAQQMAAMQQQQAAAAQQQQAQGIEAARAQKELSEPPAQSVAPTE